jgi:hypothetical protein
MPNGRSVPVRFAPSQANSVAVAICNHDEGGRGLSITEEGIADLANILDRASAERRR